MKEIGLIFSTEMALANIERRKSMTRRTQGLKWINQDPDYCEFLRMEGDRAVFRKLRNARLTNELPPLRSCPESYKVGNDILTYVKCPFGQVGGKIWQREGFGVDYVFSSQYNEMLYIDYKAGGREDRRVSPEIHKYVLSHYGGDGWHPAIHMFRWMSRFEAPITELRVERLQNITKRDAFAEGFKSIFPVLDFEYTKDASPTNPKVDIDTLKFTSDNFLLYWQDKNEDKGYGWDLNKWVWVIGYKNAK